MDDLVKYRLDSAIERIKSSEILYQNGQWKDSISRSYYAIFTAARALLATIPADYARHAGVISCFHKEFVHTNLFDKRYGKILDTAFQIRNNCDYNDFYLVSADDARDQLEKARDFVNAVKGFLNQPEDVDKTIGDSM